MDTVIEKDAQSMQQDYLTRAMYGEWARHVPAWLYVQDNGEGQRSFVGATQSSDLSYGQPHTHQFILGELIVRPHFAVSSNAFRGHGLTGLATVNHSDFLLAEDLSIICDPMGVLSKMHQRIQAIL